MGGRDGGQGGFLAGAVAADHTSEVTGVKAQSVRDVSPGKSAGAAF